MPRLTPDMQDLIVGLDIGTSKVLVLVAEVTPNGKLEIIGIGQHSAKGCLRRGMIVNMDATVNAILSALEEAELMADCKIHEVHAILPGSYIQTFNSRGMVAIRDQEVTQLDIDNAIETARAVNIPNDQQILHILTQEFIVDDQHDIHEPLGMMGMRLEVKIHMITGGKSTVQNITSCIRKCGLSDLELVVQPIAASTAVLTNDEKELGVCVLDIGGGTTDIVVFSQGAVRYTGVLPVAGDQITNDIAIALQTPTQEAEKIKVQYGCALRQMVIDPDAEIEVPSVGERQPRRLSLQVLSDVIEPRVEEIYVMVQDELQQAGLAHLLTSGIVLTGGTSLMRGMVELAEEIFHVPVRRGVPFYHGHLSEQVCQPRYAGCMGLLQRALEQVNEGTHAQSKIAEASDLKSLFSKVKDWLSRNF